MGQRLNAIKAAASVVFGTGPWQAGQEAGTLATDLNIYDPVVARNLIDGMTPADLYATQPHMRTVVSFVARNAAQLGRHVYARTTEDGRTRMRTGVAAGLAEHPNDYMSGYDLFNMLFSELAIYDFALWVPAYRNGRWQIDPIPGEWVTGYQAADAFRASRYRIQPNGGSKWYWVDGKDVVVFRGYSPDGFAHGSPTVNSLKGILSEQIAATEFRSQMWKRGGRVGMFMTRPKDAPAWSKEAKQKFVQNWKNNWSGAGTNAGSTPLLEDGMELKRIGFNAKEEQWLEAATLSLSTVAGAFHVPPAMVGVSGYNSFASVKEFRKMLYTETLGPLVAQVEETWNTFLMPIIGAPANQYLELNIGEKLQGDFEEQGNVLFQAVGGPYMTPNEARKKINQPPIDGGDVLLAPLNMGASGNNGPVASEPIGTGSSGAAESADPNANPPKAKKSSYHDHTNGLGIKSDKGLVAPAPEDVKAMAGDLAELFKRQRKALQGASLTDGKASDPAWWNQKAWNQELSALLQPRMQTLSAGVARGTAGAKGLDPDEYSVARTVNFLKAVADSRADLINSTTRDEVLAAVKMAADAGTDPLDAIAAVFDRADTKRAPEAAATMATMLAAWAATEVARQLVPAEKNPVKTWVSSGLPNSRHAGLNGETVPIDAKFSNGADWPGDPVLGAAQVANCGCGVDISYD